MSFRDIVKLPILPSMSREMKRFRSRAPVYLQYVIERSGALRTVRSLEEIGKNSLQVLTSGRYSAVFFFRKSNEQAVIKIRPQGLLAEAEALEAWRKQGVQVTRVKKIGSIELEKKIRYMVQEAVMKPGGTPALTVKEYVEERPEKIRTVGKLMGRELAKMHRAHSRRSFGEYSDLLQGDSSYETWNEYLLSILTGKKEFLLSVGMTESMWQAWYEALQKTQFSGKRVYLHGDFSLRNALIEKTKPLSIRIIDPNPLIGDPSWDLSNRLVNEEIARKRHKYFPHNEKWKKQYHHDHDFRLGVFQGYEQESNEKIDERSLLATLTLHLLIWYSAEYDRRKKEGKDPEQDEEVALRKQALFEKVEEFLL